VVIMWLRRVRIPNLTVVLSRGGKVGVVVVWTKCIAIELFTNQVLWPVAGVSLAVVVTWESQFGAELIAVMRSACGGVP